MEEKIGFFKRMGIAIAKPKSYDKLANQKVGNTIGTFFIITLLETILITVLVWLIMEYIISVVDNNIDKVPDFTISNGILDVQSEEPFVYGKDQIFIIDDSITFEEVQSKYTNEMIASSSFTIITKEGLLIKSGTEDDKIIFSNVIENDYTKDDLLQLYVYLKNDYKVVFLIALFVVLTVVIFVIKLFGGVLFAIFGWFIASMQNKKIPFRKLFNISMYATVTTTLIFFLGGFVLKAMPIWSGIELVIIALYIIFAIKYLKTDETKIDSVIK